MSKIQLSFLSYRVFKENWGLSEFIRDRFTIDSFGLSFGIQSRWRRPFEKISTDIKNLIDDEKCR